MTIFILDKDLKLSAQYLDDKSLDKQIKTIAQVLCNVHWYRAAWEREGIVIPLQPDIRHEGWTHWGEARKGSYLWLAFYLTINLVEYEHRFISCNDVGLEGCSNYKKKYATLAKWAINNLPNLPEQRRKIDNLPLIMPKKYITDCDVLHECYCDCPLLVDSYRKYYKAKLSKKPLCFDQWTRREKPEWLGL